MSSKVGLLFLGLPGLACLRVKPAGVLGQHSSTVDVATTDTQQQVLFASCDPLPRREETAECRKSKEGLKASLEKRANHPLQLPKKVPSWDEIETLVKTQKFTHEKSGESNFGPDLKDAEIEGVEGPESGDLNVGLFSASHRCFANAVVIPFTYPEKSSKTETLSSGDAELIAADIEEFLRKEQEMRNSKNSGPVQSEHFFANKRGGTVFLKDGVFCVRDANSVPGDLSFPSAAATFKPPFNPQRKYYISTDVKFLRKYKRLSLKYSASSFQTAAAQVWLLFGSPENSTLKNPSTSAAEPILKDHAARAAARVKELFGVDANGQRKPLTVLRHQVVNPITSFVMTEFEKEPNFSELLLATPNGYNTQNFVLMVNKWLLDHGEGFEYKFHSDACKVTPDQKENSFECTAHPHPLPQ
eukprot:gene1316-538_t